MDSTKKQGRTPIYEATLKIAVAREYLTSNLGYGRLAQKYGLKGADTVRGFVKWYKERYPDGQSEQQEVAEQSALPARHAQKDLREANLKIAALETLIEIAQKELGIDIVKKYGTKQSSK